MSTSRNAPCWCGSGRKLKRCCGARMRDQATQRRRDERVWQEMEGWAFLHFGAELVASAAEVRDELGGHPDSSWIAMHWALLDHGLRAGGTAAARYAALPHLSTADRDTADRLASSRVGVHRVLACRPRVSLDLEDVLDGARVRVASEHVSAGGRAGDLLVARVLAGEPALLWGPARPFPPIQGAALVDELRRLVGEHGRGALREAWPSLMALDTSLPRLAAFAEWAVDDPAVAFEVLEHQLHHVRDESGADLFMWGRSERPEDFCGMVSVSDDGVVLCTYAETLLDEGIAMLDAALGANATFAGRRVDPLSAPERRRAHRRMAA